MAHCLFGPTLTAVPFDWAKSMPQKTKKNGADYYSGSIFLYSPADFDAMWALRAVVNVRPVADAVDRVYVDSWADPASIRHTLSMNDAREEHIAILTEFGMDERYWSGDDLLVPGRPLIVAVGARVEFLLLS